MMGMEMMEIKEMRSENEIMFPPIGGAGSRSGDEAGVICSRLACHEGLDEELSVLPRHTKVIVTGNNRTKSVLVGLQGVVKKAVGLGGWHWLVLTNGLEVKLQRNALSVLEPPTGLEEDNDSDDGNPNVEENQRPFKLRMQPQRSSAPKGAHRSHLVDISPTCPKPSHRLLKVNLGKLETTALLRYWRRFNLVDAGAHLSKEQLVDAVERHFSSQQLDEFQVISQFIQAAKRLKTVYG